LGVALQTTSGGEQLSGAILGYSSGGQLWRAISGNNFGERQLSGIALRNTCFEAQQLSSRFTRNFGEQFLVATLDNCVELLSGTFLGITLGNSFGDQLWDCGEQLWDSFGAVDSSSGAASGISFGEQLSGTAFGA